MKRSVRVWLKWFLVSCLLLSWSLFHFPRVASAAENDLGLMYYGNGSHRYTIVDYNGSRTDVILPDTTYVFTVSFDNGDTYLFFVNLSSYGVETADGKFGVYRSRIFYNSSGMFSSATYNEFFQLAPYSSWSLFSLHGVNFGVRTMVYQNTLIEGCPHIQYFDSYSYTVAKEIAVAFMEGVYAYRIEEVNNASFNVDLSGIEQRLSAIEQYNQTSADNSTSINGKLDTLSFEFSLPENVVVNISNIAKYVAMIWFVLLCTFFLHRIRSWRNITIGGKVK